MSSRRSAVREVRQCFDKTWTDFYNWRPLHTRPLSLKHLVGEDDFAVSEFHQLLDSLNGAGPSVPTAGRPAGLLTTQVVYIALRGGKSGSSRGVTQPHEGSFVIAENLSPVPQYSFCVPTREIKNTRDENRCAFIPMVADEAIFPEMPYMELFEGQTSSLPGRDADVDIILVETVRRLFERGLQESIIDSTRVLPLRCVLIRAQELQRDLPPFPPEPMRLFDQMLDDRMGRVWSQPLKVEPDQENKEKGRLDVEELWCRNGQCQAFGCGSHIGDGKQYIVPLRTVREPSHPSSYRQITSKPCSRSCQLRVKGEYQVWPDLDSAKLGDILRQDASRSITSCELRYVFATRTCSDIAHQIQSLLQQRRVEVIEQLSSVESEHKPVFDLRAKLMTSSISCVHHGPCRPGAEGCLCAIAKMHCERTCFCDVTCPRRFRGCSCRRFQAKKGQNLAVCVQGRCECMKANRECDPDVCGDCGAAEILAGEGSKWACCGNVDLQKREPVALRVGASVVAGYGLFAAQCIEKGQAILEYAGESISHKEADKRGMIYASIKRNYLFELNAEYCIDSANMGNISRFMNSATGPKANCVPKVLHVLGDHRILLVANRKIKPHEELFFDYGEKFDNLAGREAVRIVQKPKTRTRRR